MWVPPHINIPDNEMADKTADLATRTIFRPTITDLPINDIKASIKQKIITVWQNYSDSIPVTNKCKKIKKYH
jgi:hypothetical protein